MFYVKLKIIVKVLEKGFSFIGFGLTMPVWFIVYGFSYF